FPLQLSLNANRFGHQLGDVRIDSLQVRLEMNTDINLSAQRRISLYFGNVGYKCAGNFQVGANRDADGLRCGENVSLCDTGLETGHAVRVKLGLDGELNAPCRLELRSRRSS